MKVLCKQKVFQANLTRYAMTERKVLSVMDSPFVVKLHFAFQTENKLYLLMDYCPGGDLEMILFRKGTFKESLVKLYITEIVLALEALH
jgi:protein-serine/threonine kinase